MYEHVTVVGPGSYAKGESNHLKNFLCGRGAHHTPAVPAGVSMLVVLGQTSRHWVNDFLF